MRKRIFEIIEVAKEGDRASDIYDTIMLILIIISIVPLTFKKAPGFFVITDKYISGRVDIATLGEKVRFDETIEGYRGNGSKILYMIGDKVRVECTGAYPETREIDFKLVRKL